MNYKPLSEKKNLDLDSGKVNHFIILSSGMFLFLQDSSSSSATPKNECLSGVWQRLELEHLELVRSYNRESDGVVVYKIVEA